MSDIYKDLENFQHYAQSFLKIRTKNLTLERIKFNIFQIKLAELIVELVAKGVPIRIIILKARQLGISTFIEAYIFWRCSTSEYLKALVIANDRDNTTNLFEMSKRFYDQLPEPLKPMKRYSNEKRLVYENPDETQREMNPGLMSEIFVQTAGKSSAGRSSTNSLIHGSEVAFWPHAGTLVSGMLSSCPLEPGTFVALESTANGVSGDGEEFYNRWESAMAKESLNTGEARFMPIFFPWYLNPEYSMRANHYFTPTYEENVLAEMYKLTKDQLCWRRYKIENEMGSALVKPEEQFMQEYPSNPEEAFIASGRPVFDIRKIDQDIKALSDLEYTRGELVGIDIDEREDGRYKFFKPEREFKAYAIGADVAEGVEGGDFSAMCIIDKEWNHVGSFHGHLAPDEFGREMCKAGEYFNNAVLAPEYNNHGISTLDKIRNLKYPHVYTRPMSEEDIKMGLKPKLAWHTNKKTKMKMLDDFVAAYRDGLFKPKDVDLLREMRSLVVESDGNVELTGKDRVVAACIALQAIDQAIAEEFRAFVPGKERFEKAPETIEEKIDLLARGRRGGTGYFD